MTDRFKEFVADTEDAALQKASTHYGVESEQLELKWVSRHLELSGLAGRSLLLAARVGDAGPESRSEGRGDRGRRERRPREERGRDRDRDRGRDRGRDRDRDNGRGEASPARAEQPLVIEKGELGQVGEFVERVVRGIARGGKIRIEEEQVEDEARVTVMGDGADELARRPGLGAALSHLAHRVAQNLIDEDASAYVQLGERRPRSDDDDEDPVPSDPRLETLARDCAEDVRSSGSAVELDAMNSRERFIVHNTIKSEDGVSSESVGEGREKRVKIFPA